MPDLRSQVEAHLRGTYTLERELGGGGMSRVFVAEETALGRKVVVKVLSPELAEGLSAERFVREIKVAARLQQANIVPVLRAGELDGLPYYTMPFVTGESLRSRMAGAPVTVSDALGVLRDVAKALAYAHGEGVVHRDIKPENVLLSAGTAVVTDFGIAKAISESRQERDANATALTGVGTSLGTPAYMAPEQAAGDPSTDARADLYAWAVMAYELLAGRHPFAQHRTPHDLVRAHMTEVPEHLAVRAPAVPLAVSNLVMQCLAKRPSERPETAAVLVTALEGVQVSGGSTVATRPAMSATRALALYAASFAAVALVAKLAITVVGLPTWVFPGALGVMIVGLPVVLTTALLERQRQLHRTTTPGSMGTIARLAVQNPRRFTWRRTSIGGALALGAFAVAVAGFMAMRQFGVGPFGTLIGSKALAAKDRIVIAEMRGPASDSGLGAVFAEGMRAGLSDSRALRLISADRVAMLLGQMQRPGAPLIGEVVREVAQRAGAKAILDGDVRTVGSSYALTVRLVAAAGGDPLITVQETAANDADFTAAIGRLAKRVRERVGESLKSVNSSPELANVTTASLPALRKYTAAQRAAYTGDYLGAIRHAGEATAIDSGFAMAYRFMGSLLTNVLGIREAQVDMVRRAYAMRDRATPFERLLIETDYWRNGPEMDLAKARIAADQAYELDPERGALRAASAALDVRDYARAIQLVHEGLPNDSSDFSAYYTLALAHAELGQMDSAGAVVASLMRTHPRHPVTWMLQVQLATVSGQDSIARGIAAMMQRVTEVPLLVEWGSLVEAAIALRDGRLRDAFAANVRGERVGTGRGAVGWRGSAAYNLAVRRVMYFGDSAGARRLVDSVVRLYPPDSFPPRQRYDVELVTAAAAAGRADIVRRAVETVRRHDPRRPMAGGIAPALPFYEGLLATAEGRFAEAIPHFRRAGEVGSPKTHYAVLAESFDRAGQSDSALVYYEQFLNRTSLDLVIWAEAGHLARARQRLGELYEQRGEFAKAHQMYADLAHQWRNADPELLPVVRTIRARVAALEKRIQ